MKVETRMFKHSTHLLLIPETPEEMHAMDLIIGEATDEPKKVEGEICCDDEFKGSAGGEGMSEQMKKLLRAVALECWDECRSVDECRAVLERRLLPLLLAGQGMRNAYPVVTQFDANEWDAALAAAKERQP